MDQTCKAAWPPVNTPERAIGCDPTMTYLLLGLRAGATASVRIVTPTVPISRRGASGGATVASCSETHPHGKLGSSRTASHLSHRSTPTRPRVIVMQRLQTLQ
jgi:hypothetical protein